ncbi:MAG: hypothetical protein SFY66_16730 [Oculatellaceae cyanobacterium bins.114]|nr:hypothetical protein [Oculatellaceae cyanobacterium bins.114]
MGNIEYLNGYAQVLSLRSPHNRVEAGVSPAPPTPPIMRVRNGRFIKTRKQP